MYYSFELCAFPVITKHYTVTRNTVWGVTTTENLMIILKEGRCIFSVDGEEFEAKSGDAVFIPANHIYERKSVNGELCTMTYIHFLLEKEAEMLDSVTVSQRLSATKKQLDNSFVSQSDFTYYPHTVYLQNHITVTDTKKTDMYMGDINLFSASREITCFLQSSIALCSILSHLSQNTVSEFKDSYTGAGTSDIPVNLKRAIGYIRSNYSKQITLDDLSANCNVSKQQVIRYFKYAFNTTPINYVLDYKISKAKDYLLFQPQLTVKEIASELGFDNQHYFARIFKKITGETPSDYKYRVHNYVPPKKD